MTVREDMQAGDSGLAAWARAISVEHNDDHDTIASGRLSETGLSATFAPASVFLRDYCAEDGTTDDSSGVAAAGAALVAAGGGRLIATPGKTYYLNSEVTISAPGLDFEISTGGGREASFTFGPGVTDYGLRLTGSLTQLAGANAAYTATTVGDTVLNAASNLTGALAVGDYIMIWSSDVDNAERPTDYMSGEEAIVRAVTSNTITLDRPIRLAHTSGAERRLYRFGMVRARVRDLRFINHASTRQRPFTLSYARDFELARLRVAGKAARYGISVRQVVNGLIAQCDASNIWDATQATSPLGFGISLEGAVNVTVDRTTGERARHLTDVGSFSTSAQPGLVSRDVRFRGQQAIHTWAPAFSSHHARDISWENCKAIDCGGSVFSRAVGTVIRDLTSDGGHNDKPDEWNAGRSVSTLITIGETEALPDGTGPSGQNVVIDNHDVRNLPAGWREQKWNDAPGTRVQVTTPGLLRDPRMVFSDTANRVDGAVGVPDLALGARPVQNVWDWAQGSAGVVIQSGKFARPTGTSVTSFRTSANVPADVEVSATWDAVGTPGNSVVLAARGDAALSSDWIGAGVNADGSVAILKRVSSGSIATVGSAAAAGTVVNGDVLAFQAVKRTLRVLVNGRVVLEAADSAILSAGRAGFFFRASGGDGWAASNFKVRDLSA